MTWKNVNMHMKYYKKWWNSYWTIPKISQYITRHRLKVNILIELHIKTMKKHKKFCQIWQNSKIQM